MAPVAFLLSVTMLALASLAECGVLFSSINNTLVVSTSIQGPGSTPVLASAGKDQLVITWSLNTTFAGKDSMYSKVNLKLCFAPKSQVNRAWRKTIADLSHDRTCKAANIATVPYSAGGNTTVWTVDKAVPKAFYFVRAYAEDVNGAPLAFGQSTNKNKTTNIFSVEPISGRETSVDIAAGVFSAFAIVTLVSALGLESVSRRRANRLNSQVSG